MTEQEALLALNAIPAMSNGRIARLRGHCGSAVKVLQASYDDLLGSGLIPPAVVENIIHFSKDKFLANEYNLMRQRGVGFLTIDDALYPEPLRQIADAPVIIYTKGQWGDHWGSLAVAMVGARRASSYGLKVAEQMAFDLAQAGLVIVSGLAFGIDKAAHQGALKARGITVAVLGTGLYHPYPREHSAIFSQIIEQLPSDHLGQLLIKPRENGLNRGRADRYKCPA